MKKINYEGDKFTIEGAVSIECREEYTAAWRIDFSRKKLFPFLDVFGQGDACTCVRIAFTSDSRELGIDIFETYKGEDGIHDTMMLDLVVNGQFVQTLEIKDGKGVYFFDRIEAGMKDVEIWLDQKFPVKFKSILIEDSATIRQTQSNRKRLVCYGSSITQSVRSKSPYYTWPGIAAENKNLHITNLGFGGNCVLDPIMGYVMRDMEANMFCLELGANCYRGNLTDRSFMPCVIGLVETIRQKHKNTPIVLISPVYFPVGEIQKGESRMNMADMRDILEQAAAFFRSYGDENIHYVNGLELFASEDIIYMDDKIHPNAEGQFVLARKFEKNVIDSILG